MKPFDETKYYLGKLCKRGHDYDGTGKSLRYMSHNCVECIKNYRKENADKLKEYIKNYRKENPEKLKEYRKNNADKAKEYSKEYHSKISKELTDVYLRSQLAKNGLKSNKVTHEMIEVKRQQLIIFRGIRDIRKDIKDGVNTE